VIGSGTGIAGASIVARSSVIIGTRVLIGAGAWVIGTVRRVVAGECVS